MFIIIVGCGKVGSMLAEVLYQDGHDVVIVDNDRDSFKLLGYEFNGITITGVPIDQDILKQAGIERADALAAVTPDDNTNIMVCQMAKEIFKVPKVITRIHNPEREFVFHQFGLDTICPTSITVNNIKLQLLEDEGVSSHNISGVELVFRQIKARRTDEGKSVSEIKYEDNTVLFGVIRDGEFSFARPDTVICKNDVFVIAEKED